jgi:hypothetical protein
MRGQRTRPASLGHSPARPCRHGLDRGARRTPPGQRNTGWITPQYLAPQPGTGKPTPAPLAWCPPTGSPAPHPSDRLRRATWNLETLHAQHGRSTSLEPEPSVKRVAVNYDRMGLPWAHREVVTGGLERPQRPSIYEMAAFNARRHPAAASHGADQRGTASCRGAPLVPASHRCHPMGAAQH